MEFKKFKMGFCVMEDSELGLSLPAEAICFVGRQGYKGRYQTLLDRRVLGAIANSLKKNPTQT